MISIFSQVHSLIKTSVSVISQLWVVSLLRLTALQMLSQTRTAQQERFWYETMQLQLSISSLFASAFHLFWFQFLTISSNLVANDDIPRILSNCSLLSYLRLTASCSPSFFVFCFCFCFFFFFFFLFVFILFCFCFCLFVVVFFSVSLSFSWYSALTEWESLSVKFIYPPPHIVLLLTVLRRWFWWCLFLNGSIAPCFRVSIRLCLAWYIVFSFVWSALAL